MLASAPLAVAGLAGCASVPDSSPVQVLRQVGEGEDRAAAPGPADGKRNPLDLVRDFVFASGSSADRHGAARRFLAPSAADWDDAASSDGAQRPVRAQRLRPGRRTPPPG